MIISIYINVVLLTLCLFFSLSNVFKCVNTGVCICMSDCCFSFFFRSYLCIFFCFGVPQQWWCCFLVFVVFLLFILYMYTLKKRRTYTVMIKFIPLGDLFCFVLSICLLYSFFFSSSSFFWCMSVQRHSTQVNKIILSPK